MKKITDEILNKYIDNELSAAEIEELKNLLSSNPDELDKLNVLRFVDSSLRTMEHDKAPDHIAGSILSRIEALSIVKGKSFYFFYWIVGVFSIMIIGLFGYILSLISPAESDGSSVLDNVVNYLSSFSISFNIGLSSNLILLIGASLSIILLIAFYFLVVSHREFKNSLSH